MEYIFADYVDFFYALRMQARSDGNPIVDRMAKLFMNSLYGKFAQQREIVIVKMAIESGEYSREEVYDAITGENQITTKLFNTMTITRGRETIPGSIFSIPAHVTEYGRNLLWRIIAETGRDKVLYCDTDCIKIRKSDLPCVKYPIAPDTLGAMKIESQYRTLSINGPKDYETENMRRIKGVPKKAALLPDGSYEYKQFGRQLTHLRKGNVDDFIVKTIRKDLSRQYTKGRVSSDGTVTPWIFPGDLKIVRSMKSLSLSLPDSTFP
jgi:hypothetical protein